VILLPGARCCLNQNTQVVLRGWTAIDPLAMLVFGEDSFERSAETDVDTEVEKCLLGSLDL